MVVLRWGLIGRGEIARNIDRVKEILDSGEIGKVILAEIIEEIYHS